jgi:prefoldin subunit 5
MVLLLGVYALWLHQRVDSLSARIASLETDAEALRTQIDDIETRTAITDPERLQSLIREAKLRKALRQRAREGPEIR